MVRNFFLVIALIFFLGCKNQKMEEKYFIGKWKSGDGASFTLKKDGTCTLKDLNYSIISPFLENKNQKLTSEGIWNIVNDTESGLVDGINKGIKINYYVNGTQNDGNIIFYISGEGISGNNEPWSLYIWDGDPDDMKMYKFIKE